MLFAIKVFQPIFLHFNQSIYRHWVENDQVLTLGRQLIHYSQWMENYQVLTLGGRPTHLLPWKLLKPPRLEAQCLSKANSSFKKLNSHQTLPLFLNPPLFDPNSKSFYINSKDFPSCAIICKLKYKTITCISVLTWSHVPYVALIPKYLKQLLLSNSRRWGWAMLVACQFCHVEHFPRKKKKCWSHV